MTEPEKQSEPQKIQSGTIKWKIEDDGIKLSANDTDFIKYNGNKAELAAQLKSQLIAAPIENKGEGQGEDKNNTTWKDTLTIDTIKTMTVDQIKKIDIDQLKALNLTQADIDNINIAFEAKASSKQKKNELATKMLTIPELDESFRNALTLITNKNKGGTKKRRNKNKKHTRKNKK